MLQTEEEFLNELTQGFPDEDVDREDDEEEEDESEQSEEDDDEEVEESQGGRRKSQHSPVQRSADVARLVNAVQQEGENFSSVKDACFCMKTLVQCV